MEAVGLLVGAHFLLLYVQPGLVDPSWRTATSVKSKHRSQVFEQRHNWDNGEYRAVNGLTIAKGGRCSEVTIMNVDPKSCAGTSARRSLAQHDQSVPAFENRLGAARFWVFASTYSSTSNNSMGGMCGGQRWNVILLQRQLRVSH